MPGPGARVTEVGASADAELLAGVRAILESSFPPEERGDFDELREGLADPGRRLFVSSDGGGAVTGFAMTLALARDTYVLEYLAVADGHRDGGVGGALLDRVVERLHAPEAERVLLIEVEHPGEGGRELRARRVGFYERHGARAVECAPGYRAPRLDGGSGEVRYLLMWIPLGDPGVRLIGDRLRADVTALLVTGYGLEPGDPLVAGVVDGLTC